MLNAVHLVSLVNFLCLGMNDLKYPLFTIQLSLISIQLKTCPVSCRSISLNSMKEMEEEELLSWDWSSFRMWNEDLHLCPKDLFFLCSQMMGNLLSFSTPQAHTIGTSLLTHLYFSFTWIWGFQARNLEGTVLWDSSAFAILFSQQKILLGTMCKDYCFIHQNIYQVSSSTYILLGPMHNKRKKNVWLEKWDIYKSNRNAVGWVMYY